MRSEIRGRLGLGRLYAMTKSSSDSLLRATIVSCNFHRFTMRIKWPLEALIYHMFKFIPRLSRSDVNHLMCVGNSGNLWHIPGSLSRAFPPFPLCFESFAMYLSSLRTQHPKYSSLPWYPVFYFPVLVRVNDWASPFSIRFPMYILLK